MATVTYTTREVAWAYWVNGYNDSTDSSTTGDAWNNWASESSGTTTAIDTSEYIGNAWKGWASDIVYETEGGRIISMGNHKVHTPKKSTEQLRAEKAQRELEQIWRDWLIKLQNEEKERAEVTAQELLEQLIGEKEFAHYQKHGELLVRGRSKDYILRQMGGVIRLEKDKVHSLCIHLNNQYKYPRTDNVIALKLAIDGDERKFNRQANASTIHNSAKIKEHWDKMRELKKVA